MTRRSAVAAGAARPLEALLAARPRHALVHAPTPIESLARTAARLSLGALDVKRDDCTGLVGGGNKARKLEFLIGDALAQRATCLITSGAVQSNHVRQTAGAAARVGLRCEAVLVRRVPVRTVAYESSGNVLLSRLLGASLHWADAPGDAPAMIDRVRAGAEGRGERPYVVGFGGSTPVGTLGYVECAREIVAHERAAGRTYDHVLVATGSGGTLAGLALGFALAGREAPLLGISVLDPEAEKHRAHVLGLAADAAAALGASFDARAARVEVDASCVGEGYGLYGAAVRDAIAIAAAEGLLLDPVYTGKAFAGLLRAAERGTIRAGDRVLFLHTGGLPGLFGYAADFAPPTSSRAPAVPT